MDRRDVLIAGSSLLAANLMPTATSASSPAPAAPPVVRTVKVRDVVIGEGRVKTIVPITGTKIGRAHV